MPTKYERISIVKDPELAAAIDSVASLVGGRKSTARVVRDLAVRGAEAVREDDAARRQLRLELAEMAASGQPPWDPDVLADVDRLGWGA